MSSIVCQGLQMTPPKFSFPQSSECTENKVNVYGESESKNVSSDKLGGWDFIQALTNLSQNYEKKPENDSFDKVIYVHPLTKRSASMLSDKSLEMCTESLGSETGSDTGESIMDDKFSYLSDNSDLSPKSHSANRGTFLNSRKKICRPADNFPPPLTSISGPGGCLRVNSHREDGRLVLKAISVPSARALFHAERVDGRLTLRILSPNSAINATDEDFEETKDGEAKECDAETECGDSVFWGEDLDGSCGNVGGKMGIEKFQKTRRCKDDRHRAKELWNLEAYWVTTQ